MKRLQAEDYLKTLEFESAFKELKLIAFNSALENAKKSSDLLLYEISLNINANEARFLGENCLSVGNKILQQQEEVFRYFDDGFGGVNRKLCQTLKDDEENVKEIEDLHSIVEQSHKNIIFRLKEAREEEEDRKMVGKKLSEKITAIEEIQRGINDSLSSIKNLEELYAFEGNTIRKPGNGKIYMKKKIFDKSSDLYGNFSKNIDITQEIEELNTIMQEKIRKEVDLIEYSKSLETKIEQNHIKNSDALQNFNTFIGKLKKIKEDYAIAEQISIEKHEKTQVAQKLQRKNKCKSKVFSIKLEITLMENEDIRSQFTTELKLLKNSQKRLENFQIHINKYNQLDEGPINNCLTELYKILFKRSRNSTETEKNTILNRIKEEINSKQEEFKTQCLKDLGNWVLQKNKR